METRVCLKYFFAIKYFLGKRIEISSSSNLNFRVFNILDLCRLKKSPISLSLIIIVPKAQFIVDFFIKK